jgi:hypothetical protein
MQSLDTIHDYLRSHSEEIGARILSSYPALHGADETPSPLLSRMVRVPYPAQSLAIMGVGKRWQLARNANVVAECGAGKTHGIGGLLASAKAEAIVTLPSFDSSAIKRTPRSGISLLNRAARCSF